MILKFQALAGCAVLAVAMSAPVMAQSASPMAAAVKPVQGKIEVKVLSSRFDLVSGGDAHPFYKWMKQELGEPADPLWNFHKLLIGRDGRLIAAFDTRTEPTSEELRNAIEAALNAPALAMPTALQ